MIAHSRFVSVIVIVMLIFSIFTMLPLDERFSMVGNASADYIGFTTDIRVNDDSTDEEQSDVAMAVNGSEIYLVWHDMRNGDFDIYFAKSTDGGASWGDSLDNDNDIRVDDTDRNSDFTDNETAQQYPDIAVDSSGNIYVVWQDKRAGREDTDIYLAKSTDGGNTFKQNVRVDHNGTGKFNQQHPCIAIDSSNNIYIAWEDERNFLNDRDIYFTKSTNGGISFESPDILVDDDPSTALQQIPQMLVTGSGASTEIYIIWQDERYAGGNFDIYFSKSTDGGSTWGDGLDNDNDIIVNDMRISVQEHPSLTLDGSGDLVAVWDDEREGNYKHIYMSTSSDSGDTWSTNKKIYDPYTNNSDQAHPTISTFGNNMCVAWIDNRHSETHSDIYFTHSTDNGASFGPFLQVDQGLEDTSQSQPIIIMNSSSTAYIAWDDNRDELRGRDIYFAKSGWIILEAPSLSKQAFTPATGYTNTQFHFTVTYTDNEDDPPADGHPRLHLFKDGAGTESYPGSPFQMYRQVNPIQNDHYKDGMIFEKRINLSGMFNYTYFISTKALLGNLTEVHTNLTKGPLIDMSNVTYSNPFPEEAVWHNKAKVKCGITITDIGFAGVELFGENGVYYRISKNGTADFEDWTNAHMEWENIPNGYNVSVEVYFEAGIDNYIQWKASDKFGNGPNESEMYRIKVDNQPVTYIDPLPDPQTYIWHNEERVEVGITVSDSGGAGVNASAIEYSFSTAGITKYGDWINLGGGNDATNIKIRGNITFKNGTDNYVRWRAYDILGNGPSQSDDYQIRIDTSLGEIRENHPPSAPTNVMPKTTIDPKPHITWDECTDSDDDPLVYWIQIGNTENSSDIQSWLNLGDKLYYDVRTNLNVGTYYINLKSFDGFDFSPLTVSELKITSEGNTPPQPPTEFSPLYTSVQDPLINWAGASDAENDSLTYYLQIGTLTGGDDVLKLTWIGFTTSYEIKKTLSYGTYHISVLVYDGKDWSEPGKFEMKVADYNPGLAVETAITIRQGDTGTLELNITNLAVYMDDTITVTYSNELAGQANLSLSKNNFQLSPLSYSLVDLKIYVSSDADLNDYYLKLTATSEDGATSFTQTVIVTILEAKDTTPGNGDTTTDDDDGLEKSPIENLLKGSFFWLILIIIIIVIGVAVFLATRGKRRKDEEAEEERARARADYDQMYEEPVDYPPQPPPEGGAEYGGYDEYGTGEQGLPPPPPPQAPAGEPQAPEYYDEYGPPQAPEYQESGVPPLEQDAQAAQYPEGDYWQTEEGAVEPQAVDGQPLPEEQYQADYYPDQQEQVQVQPGAGAPPDGAAAPAPVAQTQAQQQELPRRVLKKRVQ